MYGFGGISPLQIEIRERPMSAFEESEFTFKAAFEKDKTFSEYGNNSLLVFVLAMYAQAEDPAEFAAESLTDGADDKKVDACHIDYTERRAMVAQGYCSKEWGKAEAPANKASDLDTALTWLLVARDEDIPERIKGKAMEIREAVLQGDVDQIELLYVHNCHESTNVADNLRGAADGAKTKLKGLGAGQVSVTFHELGLKAIEDLYRSRDRDILVEETLDVPGKVLARQEGENWKAVVVTVGGGWIHELYRQHHNRLFSANLRDFLGITRRDTDINAGIRQSAVSEPQNFWVYNNGITALTHKITEEGAKLSLRGISIINGAQTSGALGECEESELAGASVLCRIVECEEPEIVQKIVRYNNTQNLIRPSDLRSNDPVQSRLRKEFDTLGINYVHRRSGPRTPKNAISAETTGVALCAFHGDAQTAARNRREIFLNDSKYARVFRSDARAEHVYLVTSLASAIDHLKLELQGKKSKGEGTALEQIEHEVLRFSMSKHFVLYLVGFAAEEMLGKRISDRYRWISHPKMITADGVVMRDCWLEALRTIMPRVATVTTREGPAYDVTRSATLTEKVGEDLKAYLAGMDADFGKRFNSLRDATTVS